MDIVISQTENQLLKLFLDAEEESAEGALSVTQICERTGFSEEKVRRFLHKQDALGKLDMVYIWITSLNHLRIKVPAYKIKG